MSTVLRRPSPGRVSSGFGPRKSPGGIGSTMHQGIDFSWSNNGVQDWNVYAAADGVVEFAAYSGGWGNLTIINHSNGRKTYYAHQARFVRYAGQQVTAGEVIGIIGNTGNSVGPHLHFEYRINGVPVDPAPYFTAAASVTPVPIPIEPEEEDPMSIYIRPTGNSTVLPSSGHARIWAGDNRLLNGISYSGVWQLTEPGARRLTMAEWVAVQAAYEVAGRKIPLAEVTGNEAEIIVYAP